MRFGVCCQLSQARAVLDAGFDYVELPAGALFAGPDEPNWRDLDGIAVEATNLFILGDLKLVGPDLGNVREYAERVIPRAALAGVKVMVIGSGAARKSPAGYDLDAAEGDFLDSMAICHEIGSEHGIVIAPESLRPEETNVGNYMGDLARMLAHKGVAFTADSYHVLNQPGADPSSEAFWQQEIPFLPAHIHLGTSLRSWRVGDAPEMLGFAARLRELGYSGTVSLECQWRDVGEELPHALAQVQQLMR